MNVLNGYKTYLAAAGLIGLAVYQLSQGQFELAAQNFLAGFAAFGLRNALPPAPPTPQAQPARLPATLHDCGQASEELARLKANREKLWADRANNGAAPLPGEVNFGDCDADS